MAFEVGDLVARLRVDSSGYYSELDKAGAALDGLKGALAAVGIVASASAIALKAFGAAANMEEVGRNFTATFAGLTDEAEKFAATFSDRLGVDLTDVREQMSKTQSAVEALRFRPEVALQMSQAITQLSFDLSALGKGRPEDIQTKLTYGLMGATRGLRQLGIAANETILKQTALKYGLLDARGALDQYSTALATMYLYQEKSGKVAGAFANNLDAPNIALMRLKAATDDAWEKLGTQLMPAFIAVMNTARGGAIWIGTIADKLKDLSTAGIAAGVGLMSLALAGPPILQILRQTGLLQGAVTGLTAGAAPMAAALTTAWKSIAAGQGVAGVQGLSIFGRMRVLLKDVADSAVHAGKSLLGWKMSDLPDPKTLRYSFQAPAGLGNIGKGFADAAKTMSAAWNTAGAQTTGTLGRLAGTMKSGILPALADVAKGFGAMAMAALKAVGSTLLAMAPLVIALSAVALLGALIYSLWKDVQTENADAASVETTGALASAQKTWNRRRAALMEHGVQEGAAPGETAEQRRAREERNGAARPMTLVQANAEMTRRYGGAPRGAETEAARMTRELNATTAAAMAGATTDNPIPGEKIAAITREAALGMRDAGLQAEVMGSQFNRAAAEALVLKTELDALIKRNVPAEALAPRREALRTKEIQGEFDGLDIQLATAGRRAEAVGQDFNGAQIRADGYRGIIDRLIDKRIPLDRVLRNTGLTLRTLQADWRGMEAAAATKTFETSLRDIAIRSDALGLGFSAASAQTQALTARFDKLRAAGLTLRDVIGADGRTLEKLGHDIQNSRIGETVETLARATDALARRTGILGQSAETASSQVQMLQIALDGALAQGATGGTVMANLGLTVDELAEKIRRLNNALGAQQQASMEGRASLDAAMALYDQRLSPMGRYEQQLAQFQKLKLPANVFAGLKNQLALQFGKAIDLTDILNQGMIDLVSGMADAAGKALEGGGNVLKAVGQMFLSTLGGIMKQIGQKMVAIGIGMLGLKKALETMNPYLAIAAGAALIVAGASLSATMSRAASQVGGGGGGGSSYSTSAVGSDADKGTMTIIFPAHSVFDPSDPRQMDAFVNMMEQASGRNITVERRA